VTIAIRPFVGWDRESYSFDLGFGKTEIFLQMGLDKQIAGPPADLPVGQISRRSHVKAPHLRRGKLPSSPVNDGA
jgi:hypothetical protein